MSKIFQKYQGMQKKKAIGMLKALLNKVENGEFLVTNHGFWVTNLDEKIIFRVDVVSKDSTKEFGKLRKFS